MGANDLVNCIPERGLNWIIKHYILFYSLSDVNSQSHNDRKRTFGHERPAKIQISLRTRTV